MALEAWFKKLGLTTKDAGAYKTIVEGAGIADDETKLPELRLTRDDLREIHIKAGHRQTILDGIGEIERGSDTLADDRKDFIRRMFAVAVSVGFATRLVTMNWIKGEKLIWPLSHNEKMELFRLIVGIFVVVSGWEWYHRDLRDRPLKSPWRFYIDVAVVILTIFFLFSSDKEEVWLSSLVLIFFLYVMWDVSSYLEFRSSASAAVLESISSSFVTNFIWLAFFSFLWEFDLFYNQNNHPVTTGLFVLLAAASLRALNDPRVPLAVTPSGAVIRLTIVVVLAIFYCLASYMFA